jgi:aquaporin Z
MRGPSLAAKLGAEFLGTFWLVFGGCGSAVLAAKYLTDDKVQLGIGFVGVAVAFGLIVMSGAFAFGHVSGGHFNPAVTIGLAVAKRFEWKGVLPYVITQVVAASIGALLLFVIAIGKAGTTAAAVQATGFASNGYGDHSPGKYGLVACLITEIVLTAIFLYIILGATDDRAPKGFAPIAIGLGLTAIHLVGIPVTNLSVNPARSLGTAWFAGGWALAQVWLFIVAPIIGAAIAGASYAVITGAGVGATGAAGPDEGIANNPELPQRSMVQQGVPGDEGIANNPDVAQRPVGQQTYPKEGLD